MEYQEENLMTEEKAVIDRVHNIQGSMEGVSTADALKVVELSLEMAKSLSYERMANALTRIELLTMRLAEGVDSIAISIQSKA